MGLLVLATVLGEALVILVFVVDRSLCTQGNFFLNLAIIHLLVGLWCCQHHHRALSAGSLCIPYVSTGEWRCGWGLCQLQLTSATVFNIVLINFGFISVTRAVNDQAQKGLTRNAVLKMITVCIAAFLLYLTPFITATYFKFTLNIRKHTFLRKENLSPDQEDCEMSFRGGGGGGREGVLLFVLFF
ncbi:LOW QUALITY PROTEIN: histamine H3 receptor-like [Guaruba guarouba]